MGENNPSQFPKLGNHRHISSLATVSLLAGVVSSFIVPLLGGIVAVIIGAQAKKEIKNSDGRLAGEKYAHCGIIFGWVNIGLAIFCRFHHTDDKPKGDSLSI